LASLARRSDGVWQVGPAGVAASLRTSARGEVEVAPIGGGLVLRSAGARLWLRPVAGLRAFLHDRDDDTLITLALHAARLQRRRPDVVADLGSDDAAIDTGERGWRLFDLGLALPAATRFCLRTADPRLLGALERLEGQAPTATFVADMIRAEHATCVLLSPVGRLETARVDLRPGADPQQASPAGAVPGDYVGCARITTSRPSLESAGLEIAGPAALV
jgi:hypothetical protein